MTRPSGEQQGLFPEIPLHPLFDRPSGAIFDARDESYRYVLWRLWDWEKPDLKFVNFVLLNPSTADASEDDPTIRRCVGFARAWGFGGILVTNAFALRSTDPAALYKHAEPIGRGNDQAIADWAKAANLVVCGWGRHGEFKGRGRAVAGALRGLGVKPRCFHLTRGGQPVHPLYQPGNAPLLEWTETTPIGRPQMTRVISVRGRDCTELLADAGFVYVGRRVMRGRKYRWAGSDWGNPFTGNMTEDYVNNQVDYWRRVRIIDRPILVGSRSTLVDLYRQWVLAYPTLRSRLHELRGKTLGCWCGSWKPGDPPLGCHARVLAELADGPMGDKP
jgi:hypothetical protein